MTCQLCDMAPLLLEALLCIMIFQVLSQHDMSAVCHDSLVAGGTIAWHDTSVPCHGVFVAGLDIDATDGALLVGGQPLVDTLNVEQMHAWQPPAIKRRLTAVVSASLTSTRATAQSQQRPRHALHLVSAVTAVSPHAHLSNIHSFASVCVCMLCVRVCVSACCVCVSMLCVCVCVCV